MRDDTKDENTAAASVNAAKAFDDAVQRAKGALGKNALPQAVVVQQRLYGPATSAAGGTEKSQAR